MAAEEELAASRVSEAAAAMTLGLRVLAGVARAEVVRMAAATEAASVAGTRGRAVRPF